MRRPLLVLCASLAFGSADLAAGDDEDGWKNPWHDADMMSIEREVLPEGVTLVPDEAKPRPAAEKEVADAVFGVAEAQKVPRDERSILIRSLAYADGTVATLVLVNVWEDPRGFPAALAAKAKEKGWAFREMASPARLLVVAAPEAVRERVVALQVNVAARRLADEAFKRAEQRLDDAAGALAKTALALEPGTAFAHTSLGRIQVPTQGAGEPRPPAPAWEGAIQEYRVALEEKPAVPLTPTQRFVTLGWLGDAFLGQGGVHDAEARDRYKEALALAPGLKDADEQWLFRYDLACVESRLKELDDAFANLTTVLEQNEKQTIDQIRHWRGDKDLDNLHADPRWAALLAKYPKPGGATER